MVGYYLFGNDCVNNITNIDIYQNGKSAFNMLMDVYLIRLINLRALAAQEGGITALANRLEKSQSQISQLIGSKPIKNIGSLIAREVDRSFGKPEGWLDQIHPELITDSMSPDELSGGETERDPRIREINERYRHFSENEKEIAYDFFDWLDVNFFRKRRMQDKEHENNSS
jgi:hypothetical protein